MTKKLYLPLLMACVVALLTSCSGKMGELSSDYFTVTPQVLEAVGGKVPATINGKFPEKYFNKKAVVEVTPVLRWNGGEAKGQSAVFQGEKVEGNDQAISYKMGGNYTMKTVFDYVPEMAKSELYLEFKATIGKKVITIPAVKVADGVISTSELLNQTLNSANPANGDDAFQRIIKEKHDANIMFLIQQANVRSSELKTAKEFGNEVKDVNNAANKKISNIEISAYASPDGGMDLNTKLAENRQDNTAKLINKDLKKAKIDADVDTKYTAEDWEGFQELVSKSNIQDKELILRVLSMYSEPEQREQEIKNISSVFKTLADDILPQLRRSRLTLNYDIIGKSDEEIANLANSDAKQLNVEELLYAATLTTDPAKQEVIYTKATQIYPNDFRGYNNLGKLAYQAGNLDKAESYFKKATSIKDAPEANMNLGLIALTKGDRAAAESYMSKASGSKELNEALGNLYVAQGQYDKAATAFGDTKTNSAALAQILAKDYNKAKTTLSSIEKPDATTDYLMAVLGARTNNTSMVTSSLKSAIAKDPVLAKKAASDLEFSKYFTNADFMNIIK
ncbi:tetratricopeptide repeat protein [Bacteroides sp.]|uniref:tetratricopeptide repeat protein n=1 Tax=Bacteroides sp. TaxID=29523 RepID=UPI00262A0D26|nr:tetratricopeptide repeat protein [Bacteroides sp.]